MLSSRDPDVAVVEAAVALRRLCQMVGPEGKIPVTCVNMLDLCEAAESWLHSRDNSLPFK